MKDTLFSLKLYLQGIKKIRAVGIAASICIIVLNAIIPVIAIIENSMSWPGTFRTIEEVAQGAFAPFGLSVILFAPLMVFLMFSFLNERSKSDFYHSLPQTRTCVYVSFMAAILTWLFAILVTSSIVNSLLWLIAPYYHLSFITVILSLISQLILSIFMAGFMCLAMTLTGTSISNLLIFTLVTLFVRTTGTIFIYSVEEVTPVFLLSESWLKIFSFEYFLPWHLLVNLFSGKNTPNDFGLLIYSLVIGLALIGLAGILYKKRRSEIAGQSAPNKILQMIYRSAVTLPFLLIIVFCIVMDGVESYLVILLAIALLVYLLFELLTTKKVKSMFKSMRHFYIPLLAAFIFFCGIYATRNSIMSVQPDPDEIKGITIVNNSYRGASYEEHQTRNVSVNVPEANEIVSEALKEYINHGVDRWNGESMRRVQTIITLKSGRKVGRIIYVPTSEYFELIDYFTTADEYAEKYVKMPSNKEITNMYSGDSFIMSNSSGANAIWSTFIDEYNALPLEKQVELKQFSDQYAYRADIMSIQVNGYLGTNYFHSWYAVVSEFTPKTVAAIATEANGGKAGAIPTKALEPYRDSLLQFSPDKDYSHYRLYMSLTSTFGQYDEYSADTNQSVLDVKVFENQQNILDFLLGSKDIYNFSDPDRKLYRVELNCTFETYYEDDYKYGKGSEDGEYEYVYETISVYVALTDGEFSDFVEYFKYPTY